MDYDKYRQNCKRAATDQGLDPISARLRVEGIDHTVDQTGGYVMLIRVPLREPAWIGVNAGETRSGHWFVVFYADDEGDEGQIITDRGLVDWTTDDYQGEWLPDDAVTAIRKFMDEPRSVEQGIRSDLERLQPPTPDNNRGLGL